MKNDRLQIIADKIMAYLRRIGTETGKEELERGIGVSDRYAINDALTWLALEGHIHLKNKNGSQIIFLPHGKKQP